MQQILHFEVSKVGHLAAIREAEDTRWERRQETARESKGGGRRAIRPDVGKSPRDADDGVVVARRRGVARLAACGEFDGTDAFLGRLHCLVRGAGPRPCEATLRKKEFAADSVQVMLCET